MIKMDKNWQLLSPTERTKSNSHLSMWTWCHGDESPSFATGNGWPEYKRGRERTSKMIKIRKPFITKVNVDKLAYKLWIIEYTPYVTLPIQQVFLVFSV